MYILSHYLLSSSGRFPTLKYLTHLGTGVIEWSMPEEKPQGRHTIAGITPVLGKCGVHIDGLVGSKVLV